jgi:hypothetical protein
MATSPLVQDPSYRKLNLAHNGIYFRKMNEKLPTHVQSVVDEMFKGRQSPEPEVEAIKKDTDLNDLIYINGNEVKVTQYLRSHIFERPQAAPERLQGLDVIEQIFPLRQEHIPAILDNDPEIDLRVSQPKPDILYGYMEEAFTSTQQKQLLTMKRTQYTASNEGIIYPFLVVELKGSNPTANSLFVAENQCIGGAATCVNMVDKLNQCINGQAISAVDPIVFGVTTNGREACLFVSWKENDKGGGGGEAYYMQQIEALIVYKPNDYLVFRRFVRNVLEWGKEHRRAQIGAVLDALREESQRKRAATIALREESQRKRAATLAQEPTLRRSNRARSQSKKVSDAATLAQEPTLRRSKRAKR